MPEEREKKVITIENLWQNLYGFGFAVGTDPEIFVENSKGYIIPAFKFLQPKEKPGKTSAALPYGGYPMYWDGFAAEFETSPQNCLAWTCDSTYSGIKSVMMEARKYNKNCRLSAKTVIRLTSRKLKSEDPAHILLGCAPSFNAYGLVSKPLISKKVFIRSTGGHIHFGIKHRIKTPDDAIKIVKVLDAILAVACVSLFENYDVARRREYYGLVGEYRLPPHGLEYRVLSNAWIFHPLLMNLVFDLARKCVLIAEKDLFHLWQATEEETIDIVMKNDVSRARAVLSRNEQMLKGIFSAIYSVEAPKIQRIFDCFMGGMDSFIANPKDIVNNWDVDRKAGWVTHCDGKNRNVKTSMVDLLAGNKV